MNGLQILGHEYIDALINNFILRILGDVKDFIVGLNNLAQTFHQPIDLYNQRVVLDILNYSVVLFKLL